MKEISPPTGWCRRLSSANLAYRPWLADRGSLTRRLKDRCPRFGVRPLRQDLGRPFSDEREWLRLGRSEMALVREVYLLCGGAPVVFAHSVLVPEDLRGVWNSVSRQGAKPLGEALFSDPRVERAPLEYRELGRHHPLYRRACAALAQPPARLWARRSLFTLRSRPLLVTEVFLPAVLEL
ncbi:MAG TPA: chorismate lyase [Burkholderiales bacterium]|nr:chorismate lyase [Burkholderiales bacterium]